MESERRWKEASTPPGKHGKCQCSDEADQHQSDTHVMGEKPGSSRAGWSGRLHLLQLLPFVCSTSVTNDRTQGINATKPPTCSRKLVQLHVRHARLRVIPVFVVVPDVLLISFQLNPAASFPAVPQHVDGHPKFHVLFVFFPVTFALLLAVSSFTVRAVIITIIIFFYLMDQTEQLVEVSR